MAEIRDTEVERDTDGHVVGYRERRRDRSGAGGFGWGLILGALLIIIGVAAYSYSQGSFSVAGRQADHVTAQAEHQIQKTTDAVQDQQAQNAQPAQTQQQ